MTVLTGLLFLLVGVEALIALLSVAGGIFLARRRPDLGGFRRHTRALWVGFHRPLRRLIAKAVD
ncbi:MAG: hypothetical protein AABM42_07355 [Actinomycetota bacterium]